MKHTTSGIAGAFFLGVICAVGFCKVAFSQESATSKKSGHFRLNQLGFQSERPKKAVVSTGMKAFVIEDTFHRTVYKSSSLSVKFWPYSGDSVRIADFSSLRKEGKYWLVDANDKTNRIEFYIADTIYRALSRASLKAFYFNRASVGIPTKYGGIWSRPEGHPDTKIIIHSSAASKGRPEGTVISSPKGWYDAGDYNKYIVNSGITGYTLLLAYQLAPEYYKSLTINIPETGNGIPDILNELLWNLRWMITMQDPADGGVYHKLTNKGFDGFVMPDKAVAPRYVVQKSTAAALDFAAVMANSYRVFSKFRKELPGFADSCLAASKAAWGWALANPSTLYDQPQDISTGKYDDTDLKDEWTWAGVELALATHSKDYLQKCGLDKVDSHVPTWNNVGMLAVYSMALFGKDIDEVLYQKAQQQVVSLADRLLQKQDSSAYNVSIDYFDWGSNSDVAQQGVVKVLAHRLTKNVKYLNSASSDLDYLLGRNAVYYSFVSGFGTKSPMHLHHRPSAADGIENPVPGFLVGGPNLVVPTDCSPNPSRNMVNPAKSYDDSECSYSTNEIAINWNAPLAFLVGLLDSERK